VSVTYLRGSRTCGPHPDNLRALFHSTALGHAVAAKFKNERLDQLLAQGAETTNVEQRRTIYKEAEQIILDEAPCVFLLWRPTAEAAATYVKGYIVVPGGTRWPELRSLGIHLAR
jgi:ABC-type transport system substrate-binding protein